MLPDSSAYVRAAAWPTTAVSEVMSRPVLTIDVTETLWDAWQLLSVSGLRHLAVMEEGRCVGVISDRSILSDIPVSEERMRARRVGQMLPRGSLRAVGEQSSLADVGRTMVRFSIEAVPVISADGRLIGIVTGSDLVRWLSSDGG